MLGASDTFDDWREPPAFVEVDEDDDEECPLCYHGASNHDLDGCDVPGCDCEGP